MQFKNQPRFYNFLRKIEPQPNGCWNWIGNILKSGYGLFRSRSKQVGPHRFSYETFVGAIPRGLTIDHLCNNRICVNPEHMAIATLRQNVLRGNGICARNARKTHCKRGHPLSGVNLRFAKLLKGGRECQTCYREYQTCYIKRNRRGRRT